MVGAIPSTLHQKVKFVVEEQLISMATKEDIVVVLTTSNPYIEVDENVVKCSFQSLEVVNATFIGEGKKIWTPRLLKVSMMGIKQIINKGVRAGLGLGKILQGTSKVILVVMKQDRYGLGYKADARERNKQMKNRRDKRMASLKDVTVEGEPMVFLHLCETFYSSRIEHDIRPKQITMMEGFENLTINVIEGIKVKREDVRAMMRP